MKTKTGGFKSKLWLCCKETSLRRETENAVIKDGYLYVTDASVILKQKIELHGIAENEIEYLNGKSIHMDTLKELSYCDYVSFCKDGIKAFKKGSRLNFEYGQKFSDNSYFYSLERVIQEHLDTEITASQNLEKIHNFDTFSFSPELMKNLYDAMKIKGEELQLKFTFTTKKGLIIRPCDNDNQIGILMQKSL